MDAHAGTLASVADRLAVEALIYRYADAVTRADWVRCEATFHPDAVWESPLLGMHYATAKEFLDVLAETSTFDLLIQTAHSPVIEFADDTHGHATTTVRELVLGQAFLDNALGETGSVQNFEQFGVYFDDVVKTEGEWRFAHRLFVPMYVNMGAVSGQVLAPRTSLRRAG